MPSTKIQTNYPINLTQIDKPIFDQVIEYKLSIPAIKILKNTFVTNNGLVLKNGILEKKCALNLLSKHDHTFYFNYWKKSLEQFFVCKFGKSLPSITLNSNQKYLIIHSNWINYSFWITEYLTRLIRVEKEIGFSDITLLYPEEWDTIPYIVESLKAFNIPTFKIPSGNHLFIKHLIFPEVREITSFFYPDHIKQTKERLLQEAFGRSQLKNLPNKIYLTRGKNVKRAIANEDDLQDYFQKNGYSIVSFEKLSIWDQIVYIHSVDILFTIHGAGFANVMFMKEGSYALEFLERDFAYYANPFPHLKLASAVGVNYAYQLCSSDQTKNISYQPLKKTNVADRIEHVDRNISVNLVELNTNREFIEAKFQQNKNNATV
jgi:hypothetical protein